MAGSATHFQSVLMNKYVKVHFIQISMNNNLPSCLHLVWFLPSLVSVPHHVLERVQEQLLWILMIY